jgi:class 3 adenylate cyclase
VSEELPQTREGQRVLGAAEDQVEAEALGELTLKGFSRPVAAHNVLRWKT